MDRRPLCHSHARLFLRAPRGTLLHPSLTRHKHEDFEVLGASLRAVRLVLAARSGLRVASVVAMGPHAVSVATALTARPPQARPEGAFCKVIVVDRSIDLASPLLTQLCYEGLLDEVLGISNGMLRVEGAGLELPRKVRLDPAIDAPFAAIRHLNINEALPALARYAGAAPHDTDARLLGLRTPPRASHCCRRPADRRDARGHGARTALRKVP